MWSLESFYGVRFTEAFEPAIMIVFRHVDYKTLSTAVNTASDRAKDMGLGVQGPTFFPTTKFVRSARILVRGPASSLERYTYDLRFVTLPKAAGAGVEYNVWLERIVKQIGHATAPRKRT